MISGTNAYLKTYLEKALLWLECLHHILELIAAAAVALKLGPSSGPKDKVFGRFEQWFNSLTEEEIEEIVAEAASRIELLAPEDEVTHDFQSRSREFFANFFAASSTSGFQRGDYLEFARIVMVRYFYVNDISVKYFLCYLIINVFIKK
jgi:hypothetical protein